jgi:hypothetical protein
MKKEFYNLKYGKCKLLDEKKDLYLVYAENCELHYIVCIYIDNMGTMMGQEFFEKLNQAKLYFNKGA